MSWEAAAALLDLARGAKVEWIESAPAPPASLPALETGVAALAGADLAPLRTDRAAALAFWINVYNALVISGALRHGVRRSVREARGFFRQPYAVGGFRFSLDDIEHGILRGNRRPPSRPLRPPFWPWERRRAWCLRPFDVRIHFALNCGAASCPPIRHYTAPGIEEELERAARSFVAGGGVAIGQWGGVELSKLFRSYWRDFGLRPRAQLARVLPWVEEERREAVRQAAKQGIRYAPYDWSFL